jgi:type VI secretion system secreted protein VgrG
VFVFQIGTDLTTASASQVILSGVNPANVYWVERSATLGTGTLFQGNILAKASITMNTGSSLVFGRALAVAAVTMSSSPVTNPPIAP